MSGKRAGIILAVVLVVLSSPPSADAQPPAKVPRIGWTGGASPEVAPIEGFRQGLREIGYLEGQNMAIEYRWAHGRFDRLPDLAGELVRLKVDVIVSAGTPTIQAACDLCG